MKYRDKTLPVRDVSIYEMKLIGHEKVRAMMCYEIYGNDVQTFVRQPLDLGFCQIRQLGGQFHRIMDELEDKLHEARHHMKGNR